MSEGFVESYCRVCPSRNIHIECQGLQGDIDLGAAVVAHLSHLEHQGSVLTKAHGDRRRTDIFGNDIVLIDFEPEALPLLEVKSKLNLVAIGKGARHHPGQAHYSHQQNYSDSEMHWLCPPLEGSEKLKVESGKAGTSEYTSRSDQLHIRDRAPCSFSESISRDPCDRRLFSKEPNVSIPDATVHENGDVRSRVTNTGNRVGRLRNAGPSGFLCSL